ncbi:MULTISPECIES: type VI secretion system baseplate subunit TssF [unclassified Janthinobacterium]|uniref:type VI secretion system baseplate subunit TssF n=1 Tax=unclassified Janthinobacterium TaxID=2610881 RepID=UPI00160FA0EA|nr:MULTISPECIES: type VI secretion system baseplate subunit TssF [unclassified Janthinobacterium]
MDDLLPYFERELVMLRRHCREFSERYPRIAGKLHMSGESCEDPHVEHLIESVAMLAARISKRLDDDYPQFTEALFEALFPHYLRPFPSCAIVHQDMPAPGTGAFHLPASSELDSAPVRGVRCRFKTVYDIATGTSILEHASFDAMIKAPAGVRLPTAVSSSLSIVIRHLDAPTAPLRVFINGEPSFAAALRDALFMRTTCAFIQAEAEAGAWIALPSVPLKPVGFAETEALMPFGARSQPAYRILGEYFAYPEKFNFFDIDIAALSAFLPAGCQCFTLHLGMAGLRPDSDIARMLSVISEANLLLGCSPVVNLFRQSGVPIAVTRQKTDYTVLAHATHPHGYEVLGIDAVHLLRQREGDSTLTEFRPLYSLRHGEGAAHHYWVLRHDGHLAEKSPGHEKKITLVDRDFNPLIHEKASLSTELTCSNRDLPLALKYGQPQGDLQPCSGGNPLRLLRRPSPPRRFAQGFGLHWRLISHLTLNHHALTQEGLPALREMLTLYDLAQSATSQRLINGIAALTHVPTTTWLRHRRGTSLVHGVELRMTLDEEAFVGSSMHLFVQVIDHFLGLYVQINSFIELIVLSLQSGEELIRCKPRSGLQNLV